MHARYRCFYRYGTLHNNSKHTSTNFLDKAELENLPNKYANQYKQAINDGNSMAKQYEILHIISVSLCVLLFIASLIGITCTKKQDQY